MTAQFSDTFDYQGKAYDLIGISGGELPTPQQFGITPEAYTTACYRGYFATYELTADALILRSISLCSGNDYLPPIPGTTIFKNPMFDTYRGLNRVVNLTGKIRLARDFIWEYYVHMGFQKATAYRTVLDITLKEGRIQEIRDRSEEMERKRGDFKFRYHSVGAFKGVAEAFSLDLDLE